MDNYVHNHYALINFVSVPYPNNKYEMIQNYNL